MKKSFLFSLAICLNGIMTGCMTGGGELRTYCYYKWINESNHTLTLTAENEPELFESVVLAPGESIEKEVEGNLDIRNPYQYLYDLGGITLLVDDGAGRVEFGWSPILIGPPVRIPMNYDFALDLLNNQNYTEDVVENPNDCSACTGRRWTYTFTDADYEAAVAYAEREQETEEPAQ